MTDYYDQERGKETPAQPRREAPVKKRLPKPDKYIMAIYIAILVISVIELYSASSREVQASNVFGPLIRHGRMLLLGVVLTFGIARMHYKFLIGITPVFVTIAVILAVYVLFKGDIINGARRSTTLLGIPIQPSELLKLAVVMTLALIMSKMQEHRGVKTSGVVACAGFVGLCCVLLFSQGLTNTLLLSGIAFSMMLIGGVQWRKFGVMVLAMAVLAGGYKLIEKKSEVRYSEAELLHITETGTNFAGETVTLKREGTQKGRIARWLGDSVPKYAEPITAENRQEQYSYMAQAHGGWFGQLPGNSRETARLPLAFSDYIYAIVIEDWGFAGGIILLGLYLMLLARAGAIASRCSQPYPALLVMGMAVMIVLQALFHMAIVTGVFPVSGQPLPLISKGGSSIIATSIAFGVMLSVSRYAVQSNNRKEINAEIMALPPDMVGENLGKL
ncbi:MAG: FtsW/RodA/SpoVE family cell cycle protein [Muribaculaceae bacterium]|nr:FtsW/RodA/SpoVE family cell cycle protein [Muribaculaceae bacterium]